MLLRMYHFTVLLPQWKYGMLSARKCHWTLLTDNMGSILRVQIPSFLPHQQAAVAIRRFSGMPASGPREQAANGLHHSSFP